MTLRILLADDHPVVRAGLRALIDTIEDLAVGGEAADGEEALRETLLLRPDVVLMDVGWTGSTASRPRAASALRFREPPYSC